MAPLPLLKLGIGVRKRTEDVLGAQFQASELELGPIFAPFQTLELDYHILSC